MTAMAMQMNLRVPVSKLAAPQRAILKALPRSVVLPTARQSSFFGGAAVQTCSLRARHTNARSALIVEAVKKSVGDLSKGDLEGKVVLVRHHDHKGTCQSSNLQDVGRGISSSKACPSL